MPLRAGPCRSERVEEDRGARRARGPPARPAQARSVVAVAVKTAARFSFPLGLALFVLLFVAVQGRIDRRDPKLRLAPLDSKHDLAAFA